MKTSIVSTTLASAEIPPLLKVSQIASLLSVSKQTAFRILVREGIPFVRRGPKRIVLVPRVAWESWLAGLTAEAEATNRAAS